MYFAKRDFMSGLKSLFRRPKNMFDLFIIIICVILFPFIIFAGFMLNARFGKKG